MKILGAVVADPLRSTTGAINAAVALSKAISEFLPYTLAIMSDRSESQRISGLELLKFPCGNPVSALTSILPRFAYVPLYSSHIPRYIGGGDFDLVHLHNPIPTLAMKGIAKACIRKKIPYCISAHGFMEIADYGRIMKYGFFRKALAVLAIARPFRFVVANAAWIFTLSPIDDRILRRLGFPLERRSCVTNGVSDFFLEPPTATELNELKGKLALHSDPNPKLVFVGSMYPYKGVDIFLDSLRYVDRPVTAVVGGKFKSSSEKDLLLRKTHRSSLENHRILFTGWLTDLELRSLYHLADVFVYPTRGDTLPLCILEAMACGAPIVSTEVGGIPFQLAENSGCVVPPEDPYTLAVRVSELIADRAKRLQYGLAAQARVKKLFNWRNSAIKAVEEYGKILGSNSGPPTFRQGP